MLRQLFVFLFLSLIALNVSAQSSLNVLQLCNWKDTTNAPVNGAGQHWNDVWGFTWKGIEYAVIGGTNGAHVIDIDQCKEVDFLPGKSKGVIHRDFKTYSHYLYAVAGEGFAGMQVYDFSYLPDSLHLIWESNLSDFSTAHGIFIDTARSKLYGTSTENTAGQHSNIRVYSLADPEQPAFLAAVNDFDNTSHLYARNDTAWCSNGGAGMLVLDMSNPAQAKVIGGLINYPQKGFNHSSWIGYDLIGVMTDENFGKAVKVIDARDVEQIEVRSMFSPRGTDTNSIPHNPYLLGNYALVSYYMDGLQIYDISDRDNPVRTGYFISYTGPNIQTTEGAWGAYPFLPSKRVLLSDMQTGLYVLDISQATPGLSVDQKNLQTTFEISPNPVDDVIRLKLPKLLNGPAILEIYASDGRHVYWTGGNWPQSFPAQQVSLPADFRPGLYLLRMQVGGQSFNARFIKR